MTVDGFLEMFFRERLSRGSIASAIGRQLDGARDETLHVRGSNPHAIEAKHIKYAMMCKVWGSLKPLEQAVLFLQRAPTGPVEYTQVLRAVWPDALTDVDDAIAVCGSKVIQSKPEVVPRTRDEIAALLGMTTSQVKARIRSGHQKISTHKLMGCFV